MKKWLIAATVATVVFISGCAPTSEPQNIDGGWNYNQDAVAFEATVEDDTIEIYLILDDAKGLYWVGTFDSTLTNGQKIVSKADTEALAGSLYGSMDETKEFFYTNGKIQYTFGIMGTEREIFLEN